LQVRELFHDVASNPVREEVGHIPPAEAEANYYRQPAERPVAEMV